MIVRRDLVTDILDLVQKIAADDAATRATLALLRNGHPQAARYDHGDEQNGWYVDDEPNMNDGPGHPDPTGELAMRPDEGARRLNDYRFHMRQAHRHIEQLDKIRRFAKPDTNEAKNQADPDDWCKNCLDAGYCNPRTKDGGLYCKWCRTIRQTWGFLPPGNVIDIHEHGDRSKIAPALQTHKKKGKK